MVGDILRQERERQKLTIKDIEQGTSIRALYIEAIENGEYNKLPGNVYTKGFIKNYGNFLKLDGESLSHQFSNEVAPPPPVAEITSESSKKSTETPPNNMPTDEASIVSETIPEVTPQRHSEPEIKLRSADRSEGSNSGLLVAAIILIVAIAGGLWYYFTNIEGKELAQNPPTQSQQTPDSSSSSSATSASASTPAATVEGLNLQAKFNDRCWARVIVDGRVAYEGTAEAGQTLSWQATDRIMVTAGNAGAVEFIENGSNLGIAGAVGDVVEKTFVRR